MNELNKKITLGKNFTSFFLLIIFQFIFYFSFFAQPRWDHHVHLMSPALVTELKFDFTGHEITDAQQMAYTHIDSILEESRADKIVLISTGYAFNKDTRSEDSLHQLVINENNFLSKIVGNSPGRLKGFYGINPLLPFALDEIKRCHDQLNFTGIKFHFHSSKIDLRDSTTVQYLLPIFDYLASNHIPVLIHFQNHLPDFGREDVRIFFNTILNKQKPLKIIFAHTGGDGLITYQTKEIVDEILNQDKEKFHKIYFEISGAVLPQETFPLELPDSEKVMLFEKIGYDRILFGTDYPVLKYDEFINTLRARLGLSEMILNKIVRNTVLK
jgi:uncharacterized protein